MSTAAYFLQYLLLLMLLQHTITVPTSRRAGRDSETPQVDWWEWLYGKHPTPAASSTPPAPVSAPSSASPIHITTESLKTTSTSIESSTGGQYDWWSWLYGKESRQRKVDSSTSKPIVDQFTDQNIQVTDEQISSVTTDPNTISPGTSSTTSEYPMSTELPTTVYDEVTESTSENAIIERNNSTSTTNPTTSNDLVTESRNIATPDKFIDGIVTTSDKFTGGITTTSDKFTDGISTNFDKFADGISTTPDKFTDGITTTSDKFTDGISTTSDKFADGISTTSDKFTDRITTTSDKFTDRIVTTSDKFADGGSITTPSNAISSPSIDDNIPVAYTESSSSYALKESSSQLTTTTTTQVEISTSTSQTHEYSSVASSESSTETGDIWW